MSQPLLTSSIKELEKELGILIFHRSGRGVSLTNDGIEFLWYARQLYQQYESILDKYGKNGSLKKKFGISTQHYSFAVILKMYCRFGLQIWIFPLSILF